MDKQEYLEQNASKIVKTIAPTQLQETSTREVVTNNDGGLGILSIALVSITGIYILLKKSQFETDKNGFSNLNIFKKFTRHSCKKCRFFDDNSHLKCAVHPILVGKIKPEECSEYWQRNRQKFFHRQKVDCNSRHSNEQ